MLGPPSPSPSSSLFAFQWPFPLSSTNVLFEWPLISIIFQFSPPKIFLRLSQGENLKLWIPLLFYMILILSTKWLFSPSCTQLPTFADYLISLVTIRILWSHYERKNQNKCYCARVVTLIIVFKNIYQIFRLITPLKHMLITNQYVATNFCIMV